MLRLSLFLITLWSAFSVSAQVTVYAASSLTNVINEAVEHYQKETGNKVRVSYAGSSSLARQIVNGAPADIYLSANEKWMDYVEQSNQLEVNTRIDVVKNQLVLIRSESTPDDNAWAWFLEQKEVRLSLADPRHVPAGIYAKQSLEHLNRWALVNKRIASANNVRSALLFVERDEAPLGIVYKTDALSSKKVQIVETFPEHSHDPIVYPMAIIKNKESDEVKGFYEYLRSQKAQNIFEQYGFMTVK